MRFAKATAEIKQAVEAGKLSREEAGAKVRQLRAEMAAEAGGENDRAGMEAEQQRARRQRYAEAQARLEAAVEAGKLTEEQAKQRLEGLRRELSGQGARGGPSPQAARELELRERFAAAQEKMRRAVEAGKLSPEDAKAKLLEVRKELFGGGASTRQDKAPGKKAPAPKRKAKKEAKDPGKRGEPGKEA